ncbi:MAG: serine hydroxymethyltransferase [Planctomycetota bacterium]
MTTPHDQGVELIRHQDPDLADMIAREHERQHTTIELIASENHASPAVVAAGGTCLTNKYAEGYPGKRYYGGCAIHDEVETLARERAKQLFGCGFANVQPHSGAQANAALFLALLEPGDTFASLELSDGGHLSHGLKVNMSGKWFKPVHYPLVRDESSADFERIDYDAVEAVVAEHKPKLLMCGYSAYPRVIDFARFREIADKHGCILHCDMAHIAGLVATGAHPSPFPYCHVVTTTTHKTLRGPRGGLFLTNDEEIAKKYDRAVFPGMQGGPLMHIIAAKAAAFGEALRPDFKAYIDRVVENASTLAGSLAEHGYRITSGGTENHVMLVDLRTRDAELTGADAEQWLEAAGIICNKNGVPNDPRPPRVTSGVRLGTPAVTTRGFGPDEIRRTAAWIDEVLASKGDPAVLGRVKDGVRALCEAYPIWGGVATA